MCQETPSCDTLHFRHLESLLLDNQVQLVESTVAALAFPPFAFFGPWRLSRFVKLPLRRSLPRRGRVRFGWELKP